MVGFEYFAGLFDGEGCISLQKLKSERLPVFALRIFVGNTCLEVLQEFQKIWGGLIREHSKARKITFIWYVPFEKQLQFLIALFPHLIVKRKEAETAIDFLETRDQYRAGWHRNRLKSFQGQRFPGSWYPFAAQCFWHLKRLKGKFDGIQYSKDMKAAQEIYDQTIVVG